MTTLHISLHSFFKHWLAVPEFSFTLKFFFEQVKAKNI